LNQPEKLIGGVVHIRSHGAAGGALVALEAAPQHLAAVRFDLVQKITKLCPALAIPCPNLYHKFFPQCSI
jgi:hypothetical protein